MKIRIFRSINFVVCLLMLQIGNAFGQASVCDSLYAGSIPDVGLLMMVDGPYDNEPMVIFHTPDAAGAQPDAARAQVEGALRDGSLSQGDFDASIDAIQRAVDGGCFEQWLAKSKREAVEMEQAQDEYQQKLAQKNALIEGNTSFEETHRILSKVLQSSRAHWDLERKGEYDSKYYYHVNYRVTEYEGEGCNVKYTRTREIGDDGTVSTFSFDMSRIEKLSHELSDEQIYADAHPDQEVRFGPAVMDFVFSGDAVIDNRPVLGFHLPVSILGNSRETVFERLEIGLYHLKYMCPYESTDAF